MQTSAQGGLTKKGSLEQRPTGAEGASQADTEGKAFQAEGATRAKALRQESLDLLEEQQEAGLGRDGEGRRRGCRAGAKALWVMEHSSLFSDFQRK